MESLYASRTVRRFGKWALSLIGTAVAGALATFGRIGYGWIESRASRAVVATEIAKHASEVRAVREQAMHGASLSDENARQLELVWKWEIAAQAELIVLRSYGNAEPARRGRLIESAKRFYLKEWAAQRDKHANNLAQAAEQTMLAEWRP